MSQSRDNAEATNFAEAFEASLNFKTPQQGELLRGQIVSISGDVTVRADADGNDTGAGGALVMADGFHFAPTRALPQPF